MSKQNAVHTNTKSMCTDQTVHALLNRYQDNELDSGPRERVHAHLQTCKACREELSQLERITLAVKELRSIEPAPSFNALLMDRIKQKQKAKSRWFAIRPVMSSMAYSLIFLLFLGLGLLINGFFVPSGQSNHEDLAFTQLLDESQQLSLLQVQDQTFDLLGDFNRQNGSGH